jgi:hypothetical protein
MERESHPKNFVFAEYQEEQANTNSQNGHRQHIAIRMRW